MRNLALAGLGLLLLFPSASAHAAPDPLDNEIHLLADGGDDSYAYTGGLDLQDLFAREAWHRPRDAEGVIFRMIVYGSAPPGGAGGPLRLTLDWASPGGGGGFSLSSTDGLTYTAEGADLVEASMEAEGTAVQGSIQVFVPYPALGADRGAAIDGWEWNSWIGDDLRDVAPGGRPVPGTQGAAMVPEESTTVTDALRLEGPRGYTRSSATFEEGKVEVKVQNLITTTGQHILVELPDDLAGWTLGEADPAGAAVGSGEHPTFTLNANPDEAVGPVTLYVTSDLGGREAVLLQPPGGATVPSDGGSNDGSGAGQESEPGKESPGLPLVLLLAALGLVLAVRRR